MRSAGPDQVDYVPGSDGILVPNRPLAHRGEEYDESGFDVLFAMQRDHFWYRGRHRFITRALLNQLNKTASQAATLRGIDLGGGCGGWVDYLQGHAPHLFGELALGDSSRRALTLAGRVIDPRVVRFQVDLLDLGWRDRWDVAFLLDVLEHIPDDKRVLEQVHHALRPGGLLIITTPALKFFWSHNDEMAHHVRRYSRADFARLAADTGFDPVLTRYFMFFLSPLLLASRWKRVNTAAMSDGEVRQHVSRTHRVPAAPINSALAAVFGMETPLGICLPFPWGTSVLAVLRKPA